jgi:hypothetical protein
MAASEWDSRDATRFLETCRVAPTAPAIAVLLLQLVLPSIATIRDRIGEVLSAIEFHRGPLFVRLGE